MTAPCKDCVKRDYPKCYEICEPFIAYRAQQDMIAYEKQMKANAFYKSNWKRKRK